MQAVIHCTCIDDCLNMPVCVLDIPEQVKHDVVVDDITHGSPTDRPTTTHQGSQLIGDIPNTAKYPDCILCPFPMAGWDFTEDPTKYGQPVSNEEGLIFCGRARAFEALTDKENNEFDKAIIETLQTGYDIIRTKPDFAMIPESKVALWVNNIVRQLLCGTKMAKPLDYHGIQTYVNQTFAQYYKGQIDFCRQNSDHKDQQPTPAPKRGSNGQRKSTRSKKKRNRSSDEEHARGPQRKKQPTHDNDVASASVPTPPPSTGSRPRRKRSERRKGKDKKE
jgi:hypothetical protein